MTLRIILCALCMAWAIPCRAQNKPQLSENEIIQYFKQIALKQEHNNKPQNIKKWAQDIVIYRDGNWSKHLTNELNKIIADLSKITKNLTIKTTTDKAKSNYIIFIGSPKEYVKKIEPNAKNHVKSNYGYFYISWNRQREITRGTMYIDTKRAKTKNWQAHLLREEFTQSLGLMNDSYKYQDSIFYQKKSEVTKYSKIDIYLIKILYDKNIKPNQSANEVESILKKQQLIKKFKKS